MLDVQVSMLNYMATMHLMSGIVPEAIGNGHFVHVPYNSFATNDGHIVIACIGDAFFARFIDVIDLPELRNKRYLQQPARYAAKAEHDTLLYEQIPSQPTSYTLAKSHL